MRYFKKIYEDHPAEFSIFKVRSDGHFQIYNSKHSEYGWYYKNTWSKVKFGDNMSHQINVREITEDEAFLEII